MMPGELIATIVTIIVPTLFLLYLARRFFSLKEKQVEAELTIAAEKAAQYAASNAQIEQRLRVVEQIITDGGAETASQIEALRGRPAISATPAETESVTKKGVAR